MQTAPEASSPRVKRSVALVIRRAPDDPRVLLVQRPPDDEDLPDTWGLPAGSLRPGESWTEAVARSAFKLMSYKDEYEVARLHMRTGFLEQLRETFEGDVGANPPPNFVKKSANARRQVVIVWLDGHAFLTDGFRALAMRGDSIDE